MTVTALLAGPMSLLLLFLIYFADGQEDYGEQCFARFKHGRQDFILDTEGSVKDGATYLSSPKVVRYKDCIQSCCKDSKCNVAFMESGAEEGLGKSCSLFDCLYKKKYVCRFVRKTGYINYFLDSVYDSDLAMETNPDQEDSPPVANGGSDQVVQPQDGVTLNGIGSTDDQGIESFLWKLDSGNPYAVIEKTGYDDQIKVSNLTSGIYKFQLTVVDTIGQSHSTLVTVLALSPAQSDNHCMAPVKVGPCRGYFPRWHYNGASERCEEFPYGGCKANLNNYLTMEECTNACDGAGSPTDTKPGSTRFFNPALKGEVCGALCTEEQFTCANGCCLDPGLECDTKAQCSDKSDEDEEYCKYLEKKFNLLLLIPVDEKKARCTESPLAGDCRNSVTKWYYNPLQKNCVRFNYGGCNGNDNRFDTNDDCMGMCRGVTEEDIFARKEAFEKSMSDSNTGVLAVAILLGLAIFVLLGVLCYCFLKGKKKKPQQQRVATNGTQVTSIEDRERLVYNNTTKAI